MARAKATPTPSRTTKRSGAAEITPGVFVGGWADATHFDGERICVLDEVEDDDLPAEFHLPIYDDAADAPIVANLDRLAERVVAARRRGAPVLLFCGHGVRRGPLAGAWYLHRQEGLSLDAAYDRIRSVRPRIEHVRDWVGHWQVLADGDARATGRRT